MRSFPMLLALLVVGAAHATAQPARRAENAIAARLTVLGEVRDSTCDEVAISPNEKLLACTSTKPDIRIIDLSTRKSTVLMPGAYAEDFVWSPAGDRIAFSGSKEVGEGSNVWTVSVDPRTGQRTGEPRRVSVSDGGVPAFSPDAKSIVFATASQNGKRRLIVTPATGGTERTLTEGPLFGPFSWSADGKWIYYPMSTGSPSDSSGTTVYRVAVGGGSPQRIADVSTLAGRAANYYHALDREARYMAIGTSAMNGTQLKALLDTGGTVLGIASLPADLRYGTSSDYDWMPTGPRMFLTTRLRPRTLRAVSIATGASRTLLSASERPANPSWSRDGRRIAAHVWNGTRFDIAVMNADGTDRRFLHTSTEPAEQFVVDYWSPDGRYLAYLGRGGRALFVVELSTGKETKLATADLIPVTRWSPDSRSIRFVARDGQTEQPRFSFRAVGLDGKDRLVRDLGLRRPGFLFIDENWVLEGAEGVAYPFGLGDTRRLHEPTAIRPKPGVSADGKWVAFLPNGLGAQRNGAYDVVSADGQTRFRVTLSPGMQSTAPVFTADGKALIVPTVGADAYHPDGALAKLMLVPINGDAPRTMTTLLKGEGVVSLTRSQNGYFGGTVSPDGKTLLYVTEGFPVQQFFSVDLSPALTATASGSRH